MLPTPRLFYDSSETIARKTELFQLRQVFQLRFCESLLTLADLYLL